MAKETQLPAFTELTDIGGYIGNIQNIARLGLIDGIKASLEARGINVGYSTAKEALGPSYGYAANRGLFDPHRPILEFNHGGHLYDIYIGTDGNGIKAAQRDTDKDRVSYSSRVELMLKKVEKGTLKPAKF